MLKVDSDDIYESAFISEKWPTLLGDLGEIAGASGGGLFVGNQSVLSWTASEGMRETMAAFANLNVMGNMGHRARIFDAGAFGFVSDTASYTEEERGRSVLYRDFLYPRGLGYSARTAFELPTGDHIVIALEREFKKGPVPEDAFPALNELRAHLGRAALVAARARLEMARAVTQALEMLGLPGLVFDANYRVHATNALVAGLPEVKIGAFDKLSLGDANADKMFKNAVAHIAKSSTAAALSFPIRNDEGQPILVAHVIPVHGAAHDIFVRGVGVLMLTPVTSMRVPSVGLVQSLFDLTAAEARVARLVATGEPLEQIAKTNDVSVNTVRTQLQRVLDKTGCRRQVEVASLFSGLAIAPGALPQN